jgi:hypothetical protein
LNKGKLTTILLYLRNAHAYIEAALLTARSTNDGDTQARLDDLRQRTQAEVTHIEDLRGALDSTSPSS